MSIDTQHWKLRSLDPSTTTIAWHLDVYTNQSHTCKDVQMTTITVVPLWSKGGLRSNLRASNLQNFLGRAYHVRAYARTQIVHPTPTSNIFRRRCGTVIVHSDISPTVQLALFNLTSAGYTGSYTRTTPCSIFCSRPTQFVFFCSGCCFSSAACSVTFYSTFPFLRRCLRGPKFAGHFDNTIVPYRQAPKLASYPGSSTEKLKQDKIIV